MSINPVVYSKNKERLENTINPFALSLKVMPLNLREIIAHKKILSDLIGSYYVDNHKMIKSTWKKIIKKKIKNKSILINFYSRPVISSEEMLHLSQNWSNQVFRNKKINELIELAKKRSHKIFLNLDQVSIAKKL